MAHQGGRNTDSERELFISDDGRNMSPHRRQVGLDYCVPAVHKDQQRRGAAPVPRRKTEPAAVLRRDDRQSPDRHNSHGRLRKNSGGKPSPKPCFWICGADAGYSAVHVRTSVHQKNAVVAQGAGAAEADARGEAGTDMVPVRELFRKARGKTPGRVYG